MKESVTYQAIIAEGKAEGVIEGAIDGSRKLLLRMATHRFGPPSKANLAALKRITDLARLEDLSDRLLIVDSWQDLLKPNGTPTKRQARS